ncbi:MAG: PEGA domain-containing protein [Deltaproteobacteria bacterium]|nr:PEGA domain-containing protein [Deltaproteobacteria bacterium]MBN2672853.1 PEGA domain-containing protein [Deltaproteobacteria bacterium]
MNQALVSSFRYDAPAKLLFALVLTLLLCAGGGARADSREDAKQHFETGISLLELNNYKGAATQFELSIAKHPTKAALFNLANCYQAMHKYAEALKSFTRLEREYGESLSDEMREAIARHKEEISAVVAELVVTVAIDDVEIRLDGASVGSSPIEAPLIVAAGEHQLELLADGYEPVSRAVELISRQKATEHFEEKLFVAFSAPDPPTPTSAEPEARPPSPPSETTDADTPATQSVPVSPVTDTVPPTRKRTAGIALAIIASGALAAGATILAVGETRARRIESPDTGTVWNSELQDDYDSVRPLRIGGWAGLGLGILSGTISAVLLGIHSRQTRDVATGPHFQIAMGSLQLKWGF